MIQPIEAYYTSRIDNAKNPYQGDAKRVLCVCSAGLLRSPTAAKVLGAAPFNFNTRSCGIEPSYALIVMDATLLHWAQEIVCMTLEQKDTIDWVLQELSITGKKVICLMIGDSYAYNDPKLRRLIRNNYRKYSLDKQTK